MLDIDETGDIPLKGPKGAPPLTLHLDLRRLPQRHLQAIVVAEGTTYTATCTLPEPK